MVLVDQQDIGHARTEISGILDVSETSHKVSFVELKLVVRPYITNNITNLLRVMLNQIITIILFPEFVFSKMSYNQNVHEISLYIIFH